MSLDADLHETCGDGGGDCFDGDHDLLEADRCLDAPYVEMFELGLDQTLLTSF